MRRARGKTWVLKPDDEFGWITLSALWDGVVWRVEGSTVPAEVPKRCAGRW